MFDFDTYAMRHGEGWILDIVEKQERFLGIHADAHIPLEDRWNAIMNGYSDLQRMAA